MINKIFSLVIIILFSCNVQNEHLKVFEMYKNDGFNPSIVAASSGITGYIVKATNVFDEIIIIPYSKYHQIESVSNFKSKVVNDSIQFILYGEGFSPAMGYDTLAVGETQNYFVSLQYFENFLPVDSFNALTFRYHYLEDYVSDKDFDEIVKREFFIIQKDSTNNIQVYKPSTDFNPYNGDMHPLPKY